ncbi:MAG: hypothetical protein Kow00117_03960 [Phototrophicales bacterium]
MSARRRRNRRRLPLPSLRLVSIFMLLIAVGILLLQLVIFTQQESRLPDNIIVAGINVSGMTEAEARLAWEQAYAQPVILYYGDSPIVLEPAQVGFRTNVQVMLAAANNITESQGYFWVRYINYLLGQDLQRNTRVLPLSADYQVGLLRRFLEDIAARYDKPPGEAYYDIQTLTTYAGEPGFTLNIEQALQDVDNALRDPYNRIVNLPIGGTTANRPSIQTLEELIVAYLDSKGFIYDGQTTTAGIFIMNLQTGEEVNLLGDVAFSAASTTKVAILIDYFRFLDSEPSDDEKWLLANSLLCSDNGSSNLLMEILGGGNIFNGILSVTNTAQQAGAVNSFISAPFAEPGRELGSIQVPQGNPNPNYNTNPDPFNQMTAEDIGTLYNMMYDCANYGSGLAVAFPEGTFTQRECRQMLELMSANDLERLLQGGIPPNVRISHKNGWLNTSAVVGDAGIVYPPNGQNYIIAVYLWKNTTVDEATRVGFEELWPLLEEISRATWNYFSPEDALLTRRELPFTARDCEQNGYLPPYGQVDLDDINGWRTP